MTVPPQYGPPPGEPPGNDPASWPAQPPQSPWEGTPQQGQQPADYPPQPGEWAQQPYPQQPYPPYEQQPGEWAQQPYPQQPYAQQPPPPGTPWGAPPPQQPPPKRHGKLLAATAAVIVLAGGGIATYVAVSDSDSATGAASPKAAVSSIVDDLNNSDILGALDDLAPGERDALAQPVRDEIAELKRLGVLSQGADAGNIGGFTFKAQDLTFAKDTVKINDHVQIVKLTGGTLDVSTDAAKIPFTKQFLDAAFPNGMPQQSNQTQHVDIGQVVEQQRDGRPIRLATQQVDGRWYPSIFYTIADKAARNAIPAPSGVIPAKGASSAKQAVQAEVNALLKGDVRRAIELVSPHELQALHDYGALVAPPSGQPAYPPAPVTIETLDLTTTEISGGVRVGLKKIVLRSPDGERVSLAISGSCVDITNGDDSRHLCADQLISLAEKFVGGMSGGSINLPTETRQALTRMLTGLTKIGIDTSQVGGKWYVNPVRTMLDVSNSVLSALHDNDLMNLVTFFGRLNR